MKMMMKGSVMRAGEEIGSLPQRLLVLLLFARSLANRERSFKRAIRCPVAQYSMNQHIGNREKELCTLTFPGFLTSECLLKLLKFSFSCMSIFPRTKEYVNSARYLNIAFIEYKCNNKYVKSFSLILCWSAITCEKSSRVGYEDCCK